VLVSWDIVASLKGMREEGIKCTKDNDRSRMMVVAMETGLLRRLQPKIKSSEKTIEKRKSILDAPFLPLRRHMPHPITV